MAMADGYALASGKLGVLNVHVAPGLGNAMGMLYDAMKTAAPLLVTAGQQDGRFSLTEPLLWGDMVRMVESMTKWAYQIERVADLPDALRRAIKVATTPPTGPVFLGLPMDIMMEEADLDISAPSRIASRIRGDLEAMQRAADLLANAQHPLILVGDEVAKTDALTSSWQWPRRWAPRCLRKRSPTRLASQAIIHCIRVSWRGRNGGYGRSCKRLMLCSRWEQTCLPCRCIAK
jgi:benzoylformate decarboxylase